ncbi:MAG: hypothetical protein P8M72_05630 [Gammaproteobacteria bacterium]|nr:hypothetical protein [Gammaproteobacteria bacterium]
MKAFQKHLQSCRDSWLVCLAGIVSALIATQGLSQTNQWWSPGDGRMLSAYVEYINPFGRFGIVNTTGDIETSEHPFFEPIGTNGRACVTCHQPADGMSLSVASIRQRWEDTGGADPLFAAIDGMNCPHLPPEDPASHSLLLDRGLIRIPLTWPPRNQAGEFIEPEFTIEVVRDPTGCNTHPVYGLEGERGEVSVYRRPRPAANLRYVTSALFGVSSFVGKTGMLASTDPETGLPVNMNMMADAREPTLKTQAQSAALGHLEILSPLSPEQLEQITAFELQLYGAQAWSVSGGNLMEEGGPSGLGPRNMSTGRDGVLGNNITNFIFPMEERWHDLPYNEQAIDANRIAFRESVARGHDVFFYRTFWLKDAMHINSVGLGNPIKRTCATCHGMHMTGMDTANGWMDLGTTNLPWALEPPVSPWADKKPEMPLFKITCRADLPPHPFLGREIYTQDPGRALISGKCDDVGAIVIQQFRGLSARAPYFVNGSAATLRELVDFYDRRFNIRYTEKEKQDLINFLSVL